MGKRVFLVGFAGVAVVIGLWLYPQIQIRTAFAEEKLREFEDMFQDYAGHMPVDEYAPPRSGKVLIMSPSMWHTGRNLVPRTSLNPDYWSSYQQIDPPRLHEAMFSLDSDVRASDPSEVDTVILCQTAIQMQVDRSSWEDENYKYWMDVKRGKRCAVLLTVLDARTETLLGNYRLYGPLPESPAEDHGAPPDVAEFVENMPRQ